MVHPVLLSAASQPYRDVVGLGRGHYLNRLSCLGESRYRCGWRVGPSNPLCATNPNINTTAFFPIYARRQNITRGHT